VRPPGRHARQTGANWLAGDSYALFGCLYLYYEKSGEKKEKPRRDEDDPERKRRVVRDRGGSDLVGLWEADRQYERSRRSPLTKQRS
jgi:hypothetical protein